MRTLNAYAAIHWPVKNNRPAYTLKILSISCPEHVQSISPEMGYYPCKRAMQKKMKSPLSVQIQPHTDQSQTICQCPHWTSYPSLVQVKDLRHRPPNDVGPRSDFQRVLEDAVKVQHLGLGVVGIWCKTQLVCAANHLLEGAEPHLGHEASHLEGFKNKNKNGMFLSTVYSYLALQLSTSQWNTAFTNT